MPIVYTAFRSQASLCSSQWHVLQVDTSTSLREEGGRGGMSCSPSWILRACHKVCTIAEVGQRFRILLSAPYFNLMRLPLETLPALCTSNGHDTGYYLGLHTAMKFVSLGV